MSANDVSALFDRLSTDDAFANELAAVNSDPAAVQQLIAEAGFDVTGEEVLDTFLEHYGDQLTEEQLAAIAGGSATDDAAIAVAAVCITGAVVISVSAAAAAI
jgi:predicted ribosomally synthesized peptide with nif11-like leader